jgi:hypothetical protein
MSEAAMATVFKRMRPVLPRGGREITEAEVAIWAEKLADVDPDVLSAAAERAIVSLHEFPTLAVFRELVQIEQARRVPPWRPDPAPEHTPAEREQVHEQFAATREKLSMARARPVRRA